MTNPLDEEGLDPPGRPDFRRVGRGIPYVIGPEGKRVRYGRPSNAGKILDDESNLTDWKLRTTIVGAAQRPDLMAVVSTLDPQADKKSIRDIAEECLVSGKGKERTVKGTAVHSMFDHIDRGDDWEPAPQWADLCNSYVEALQHWGLRPADIEIHCINDEFRLAGSMDRRYRTTKLLVAPDGTTIPIGSMLAADTKTGSTLEYASGSYATQLAAYADSDRYNVETDEREPFQPPTFQPWGLIVHADSGTNIVEFFWVDLNAGRDGLWLAQQVKAWRTRSDLLTLAVGPVQLAPAPSPTEAPVRLSDSLRAESLLAHTRGRVRAIIDTSDLAAKSLAMQWPPGVPGLKAGGHTIDQLEAVVAVVERVEADHSIPFYPLWDDPDVAASKLNHPSNRQAPPKPNETLLAEWVGYAMEGGRDETLDTQRLANALLAFLDIDTSEWSVATTTVEQQMTVFLDATLRALGYERGVYDLGRVKPDDTPGIISAAMAITTGNAMVLYQADNKPILRTNIVKG